MPLQISLKFNLNLLEAEWTFVRPLDWIALSQSPANCSAQPHATCCTISALMAIVALSREVGLRAVPEIFLQKRPNLFFLFLCGKHCLCITLQKWFGKRPCCSVLGVCEFAALIESKGFWMSCLNHGCSPAVYLWARHLTSLFSSSLANWELQCLSCEDKIKYWIQ